MKSRLLIALAVCAQVAASTQISADEPRTAATQQAATPKKAEAVKKTDAVKKTEATQDKKEAAKPDQVPLHRQPTMVAMLKRNNELRQSVGLSAQEISLKLTKAAQGHAQYMARTGAFDHYVNGNPRTRAWAQKYTGWVSENIARGQPNVDRAFRAWKRSSGHWRNIRSNNTEVGFGYARSPNGMAYWVTLYGTPGTRVAKASTSSNSASATPASTTAASTVSNTTTTTRSYSTASKQGPLSRLTKKTRNRKPRVNKPLIKPLKRKPVKKARPKLKLKRPNLLKKRR